MNRAITVFLFSLFFISVIFASHFAFAQPDNPSTAITKGIVTGEHFRGGVMWISIHGDKATVIAQWDLGRVKIHSDVQPSSDCEQNYKICLDATVTNSINSASVKSGDKFVIKIDTDSNKQVIVGKFGFLENVNIVLDINKVYRVYLQNSTD
ncbi:MAG: hypothetical protein HC944_06370 [Nanoarchaeota archaeon]|nr:hypothetical protein [Nanoarchaeota archaeon]